MISAKPTKYLLIFALVCCSSCRFWQNSSNSNISSDQVNVSEIVSDVPFPTKEPETFQAEIVEKIENDEERRIFIARSGQRFFYRNGDVGVLTNANNSFPIHFPKKIYAENNTKTTSKNEDVGETLNDFLTTEWLNQKTEGKFESLGEENGLTKYRVSFEASEVLIFVNENFKLPVRQEFYSIEGEQKILRTTTELQNLKLQVDENIFEIPKDFRKVSMKEYNLSLAN